MSQVTKRNRASVVAVSGDKLLTVLLQDPFTKITRHFLPGGKIEAGETAMAAAIRETREETGLEVSLLDVAPVISTYPFRWNNMLYECTTAYFAATCGNTTSTESVEDAPYNKGVVWLPLSEIEEKMGFDQNIYSSIQSIILSHFNYNQV